MALGVLIVAVVLLATGIVLSLRTPLALRLTEGDCIALSSGERRARCDLPEYKLAECAAADFRITKVADESAISCDPGSGPCEFPRTGRSYCVAEAG
ncbi:hypothetical protein BW733_01970 [Tessaracoccus flavescens]|uniref:Uncharacterized protein n=1 Tax=Tessaracoccus flavescens TaxID=399497 RepID=A0A1Q2CUK3_9ACTN|nr:hypothetical protein BW733_01970 [Tessaracoccus flavescens]